MFFQEAHIKYNEMLKIVYALFDMLSSKQMHHSLLVPTDAFQPLSRTSSNYGSFFSILKYKEC